MFLYFSGKPIAVDRQVSQAKEELCTDGGWHGSRVCLSNVQEFHKKVACVPKDISSIKIDHEHKMKLLQKFLSSKNLCQRLEYTGILFVLT